MKIFRSLVVLSLMLSALVFSVYAHSGGTDGNGGHTNHSTGEYHYHHGYPAHDHYDMDGDGDLDCPYEFEDKTDHNSVENDSSPPHTESKEESSSDKSNGNVLAIGAAGVGFLLRSVLPSKKK